MTHTTHMPVIFGGPTVAGQGDGDPAREFYALMLAHPEQGRTGMVWDDILAKAAQAKVESQAREGWTGHVSPSGIWPNRWVRLDGYALPAHYRDDANNIESLSHHGDGTALTTFHALLDSPAHRDHILGANAFYAAQTHVGVGYFYLDSSLKFHYWAVISAPEGQQ